MQASNRRIPSFRSFYSRLPRYPQLQHAIHSISSDPYARFTRLPPSMRGILLLSIPIIFTPWGYLRQRQEELVVTSQQIADFHTTTVQELEASVALQLDDKLYLMGEVRIEELETHSQLHRTITERGLRINDWRDQLNGIGFRVLKKLEAWDYFHWVFARDMPIHSHLASAHQHLNNTESALALTDDLNSALFHLKRRFYPLAKRNVDKALDKLTTHTVHSDKPFPFLGLTSGYVYGHAYNIAAKIARAQGDYEQSDACYHHALDHLPHHPKLVGSQIALWGDWAWRQKNPDSSRLLRFMKDESYFKTITQDMQGYGLGLANLSWVIIQAYENAKKLALTDPERQRCLVDAWTLADQAVPLVDQMPHPSANARLFRGIASMAQAQHRVIATDTSSSPPVFAKSPDQLHQEALKDFDDALTRDPDHPSLLRRRAMVLDAQGNSSAYQAYRAAQRELRFRTAYPALFGPLQASWLPGVEARLTALKSQQSLNTAQEAIEDHLATGNYSEAHRLLQSIPAESIWAQPIRAWFGRRFVVDEETHHVMPKARENFLRQLGLYATPTPFELMALSGVTYRAKHKQPLGLPADWEVIAESSKLLSDAQDGYLAIAYRHKTTHQVVISHGGTDPTEIPDLITDIQLALGQVSSQFKQAEQFTEAVIKQEAAKPAPYHPSLEAPPLVVYHTGHSLGGALAAYVASTRTPIGSHYAVTFDNPSSYQQINRIHGGKLKNWSRQQLRNFPITAYLTRPSFINCAGGAHLGRVLRIQVVVPSASPSLFAALTPQALQLLMAVIAPQIPGWVVPAGNALLSLGLANLSCHDQARILAAFSHEAGHIYKDLATTHYVVNWPKNLAQWALFEGSLLSTQQDPLKWLPTSQADDVSYALQPIKTSQEGFNEVIPFSALETGLEELIKRQLSNVSLTDDQQKLSDYIAPYVWSCLALDSSGNAILLKGGLSSWELLTYFRQQIQEACQHELSPRQNSNVPPLTVGKMLYPDLHQLQPQTPLFALTAGWGGLFTTTKPTITNRAVPEAPAMSPSLGSPTIEKTTEDAPPVPEQTFPPR